MLSSLSRGLKGNADDALDLHTAVTFGIVGFLAVLAFAHTALTEVDTAREFAYDHNVKAVLYDVTAERTLARKGGVKFGRAKVCKQSHRRANTEKRLFGTHIAGESIPFRTADRAEKHTVCRKAACNGLLGKRFTVLINGDAADVVGGEDDLVTELVGNGRKHLDGTVYDLGADAVAREKCDIHFHSRFLLTLPYRRGSRG